MQQVTEDNIGTVFFSIKDAMSKADVCRQTLYSYRDKGLVKFYKYKNKSYLHVQDIDRIARETKENKNNGQSIDSLNRQQTFELIRELKETVENLTEDKLDLIKDKGALEEQVRLLQGQIESSIELKKAIENMVSTKDTLHQQEIDRLVNRQCTMLEKIDSLMVEIDEYKKIEHQKRVDRHKRQSKNFFTRLLNI